MKEKEEKEEPNLALDVSHQQLNLLLLLPILLPLIHHHHLALRQLFLLLRSFPVDQRKVQAQPVGHRRRPFRSSRIGGDDDGVLPVGDVGLDVSDHEGLGKDVVYGDIKEPLDLGGVQVHGDHVVGAGDGEQVGDQSARKETESVG